MHEDALGPHKQRNRRYVTPERYKLGPAARVMLPSLSAGGGSGGTSTVVVRPNYRVTDAIPTLNQIPAFNTCVATHITPQSYQLASLPILYSLLPVPDEAWRAGASMRLAGSRQRQPSHPLRFVRLTVRAGYSQRLAARPGDRRLGFRLRMGQQGSDEPRVGVGLGFTHCCPPAY